ncbi:hypothetical protein [Erwinia amylovora]|uniref:Uncharacterized protein n=5 Tax=Erwinia amylovora TaxID=552 RepID=A0A830ZYC8_ERWAM|nr:hypothetical protein [Erwinia amylovora]CBX80407.1 hypothetical protein predicted by Glimmer/Critica [Erwinia amylovora ATCC BAA-2158]ATZ11367.1 hypothetical protein AD997_07805 [Erwinia amylovora]EKV54249.1 hypothetical protein EaACW_1551 [Erwinia amylovora ACW56400]MBZ2388023.1 hypothetical protein [Erwinia amylovora]MBZ2394566.1 hypothetical protein [Erwinia amylovora]
MDPLNSIKRANQKSILAETVAGEYDSKWLDEAKKIAPAGHIEGQIPPPIIAVVMMGQGM